MRTSMVVVFLVLIALVAAPFILKASRAVAVQLKELWKEEVLGDDDTDKLETKKDDTHDDN